MGRRPMELDPHREFARCRGLRGPLVRQAGQTALTDEPGANLCQQLRREGRRGGDRGDA
jgi:hypothetical protein